FEAALADVSDEALASFKAWPEARRQAFDRVCAASDFVTEQICRDPQMLLQLADAGELERSFSAGQLRARIADALLDAASEDELGRNLRRQRARQQVRIIWRDLTRQADLIETCRDLSEMADASIDLAYQWLYPRLCQQVGTPTGRHSGLP
ncbi:Glutamate-ammonia-ligase adenylyltransferase, partial [Pseudomonas coronafaciens pv. garcae]